MKYFTSDIHFADEKTLNQEKRPFKNINSFDRYMVKSINKRVRKEDCLYVVGDLLDCDGVGGDTWKKAFKSIKKIKCEIILILGNNEQRVVENYFDNNFNKFREYCIKNGIKDVKNEEYLEFGDKKFYLTHQPKDYKKGYVNLFGHTHRACGMWKSFGLNVGVDVTYLNILSEEEILYELERKDLYFGNDPNVELI